MKQLKEALISKKTMHRAHIDVSINKKEFNTGDVVLMRNGNIGVIVFVKDIKEENLYTGIHVHEKYGSMIEPEPEETDYFSGLALNSYRDDGTSMWHEDFDIIKIVKKAIPIDDCKDPSRLYRELTSGKFDYLK